MASNKQEFKTSQGSFTKFEPKQEDSATLYYTYSKGPDDKRQVYMIDTNGQVSPTGLKWNPSPAPQSSKDKFEFWSDEEDDDGDEPEVSEEEEKRIQEMLEAEYKQFMEDTGLTEEQYAEYIAHVESFGDVPLRDDWRLPKREGESDDTQEEDVPYFSD